MDKLIKKHFDNFNINFDKREDYFVDYIDDDYTTVKNAITDICKEYHEQQLIIYDVVNSKNVLNELYIAHNWHNQQMKEVEPLSRDYFIHYGRREGVRNAIEIITGEEM